MAFRVVFLRTADRAILEKETWLSRLGGDTVSRWRAKLLHAVAKLEKDPYSYPLIEEATELGVEFREVLFGKRRHVYRLIFRINDADSIVYVHQIRHAAQDRLTPDDL
jgi:mRNA-degrading endonuclease RelE of RelBE toxin-antitoxin system